MNTARPVLGQIRRRHHTVPKFHLRGFASEAGRLVQLDVTTGRSAQVSIDDATVVRHFYTVVLPDGTRTDVWERRLAEVEEQIAPALRRAVDIRDWFVDDADKDLLATWVALQFLRGPDNRRQISELTSVVTRMQVGMGGLAYLRHAMSEGLEREVSEQEAETVWNDITAPSGPQMAVSGDEHIGTITRTIAQATSRIRHRSWGRVKFARQRLAVSDSPVTLVRDPTTSEFEGVGLAGAGAIAVPLNRHTLLWLGPPTSLRTPPDADTDAELEPNTALARAYNHSAVLGAERFVYFHPDDDPIPSSAKLPRTQSRGMQVSGLDVVNRDRPLADVLEQNAKHSDPTGKSLIANYKWPIPGYRAPT